MGSAMPKNNPASEPPSIGEVSDTPAGDRAAVTPVPEPAAEAVHALVRLGLSLATAESLTGGGLGAAVTSVPGASAAYAGGVVSYATRVKLDLLGVPADLVERH